jgi:lysophospholipase L1-like esterase
MSSAPPLWKKLFFLMTLAVLLVVVTELSLRLAGYHGPQYEVYENFVPHSALFGESGSVLKIRNGLVRSQILAKVKAPGKKRVFAFGSSLTYGCLLDDPYRDGYPSVLRTMLDTNRVEMVNVSGIGFASYRLVDFVRECLNYEPDLMIVMCGGNEFLEPRLYGNAYKCSWERIRIVQAVRAHVSGSTPGGRGTCQPPVSVGREYTGQHYIKRDAEEVRLTLGHFRWSIEQMADRCRARGVPLILCSEPSNLRDWPPFVTNESKKAKEFQGISLRWAVPVSVKQGLQDIREGRAQKVYVFAKKALERDDGLAIFHYLIAKSLDSLGKPSEARKHYILARDLDGFPHRSISSFNEAVREIAEKKGARFCDIEKAFADTSPDKIPGNNIFIDQCHPNKEGHRLIAEKLYEIARPLLKL